MIEYLDYINAIIIRFLSTLPLIELGKKFGITKMSSINNRYVSGESTITEYDSIHPP